MDKDYERLLERAREVLHRHTLIVGERSARILVCALRAELDAAEMTLESRLDDKDLGDFGRIHRLARHEQAEDAIRRIAANLGVEA